MRRLYPPERPARRAFAKSLVLHFVAPTTATLYPMKHLSNGSVNYYLIKAGNLVPSTGFHKNKAHALKALIIGMPDKTVGKLFIGLLSFFRFHIWESSAMTASPISTVPTNFPTSLMISPVRSPEFRTFSTAFF